MKFYFSGVSDRKTSNILVEAGVTNFLADPTDFAQLPIEPGNSLALDSGAYRAFKKGTRVDVGEYRDYVQSLDVPLDFFVAPDVIGDAETSFERWQLLWNDGVSSLPVWHFEASPYYLACYLAKSELVGIGGLVTPMREKNKDVLANVVDLCEQYPGRFHLFGLNWLAAMDALKSSCASIDTSKFLDAARYGHVLFTNSKTGKLSQCPARAVPELAGLSRDERLVLSARNMKEFFEGVSPSSPFGL